MRRFYDEEVFSRRPAQHTSFLDLLENSSRLKAAQAFYHTCGKSPSRDSQSGRFRVGSHSKGSTFELDLRLT